MNDSLKAHASNAEKELSLDEKAKRAPEEFFGLSAGRSEGVKRQPGLFITALQLVDLKHYEVKGLALPETIEATETYLGYKSGAGKGLEPADFQTLFTLIREHALRWAPIRQRMQTVGSQLNIFSGKVHSKGRTAEELYTDLPDDKIDEADARIEFIKSLDELWNDIKRQARAAAELTKDLKQFSSDLSVKVMPGIQRQIKMIDDSELPDEVKNLRADLDRLSEEIEQKNKEYDKQVKTSVATSLLGPLGLAYSIYTGVDAENTRKKRSDLRAQQDKTTERLKNKDKVLGGLQHVRNSLDDLKMVAKDADTATENLVGVWNILEEYVHASLEDAEKTQDETFQGETLRQLINKFRDTVSPWALIKNDTHLLLEVFSEADRIYREQ